MLKYGYIVTRQRESEQIVNHGLRGETRVIQSSSKKEVQWQKSRNRRKANLKQRWISKLAAESVLAAIERETGKGDNRQEIRPFRPARNIGTDWRVTQYHPRTRPSVGKIHYC